MHPHPNCREDMEYVSADARVVPDYLLFAVVVRRENSVWSVGRRSGLWGSDEPCNPSRHTASKTIPQRDDRSGYAVRAFHSDLCDPNVHRRNASNVQPARDDGDECDLARSIGLAEPNELLPHE